MNEEPINTKPVRHIEVRHLGLATGQVVPVKRIIRRKIEVTYIPSE